MPWSRCCYFSPSRGLQGRRLVPSGLSFEQQGIDYVQGAFTTLQDAELLGPGVLARPKPTDIGGQDQGLLTSAAFTFHVLVLVFVDLRMVFFGSPHLYIGGALFYLAIHLIKGAGQFGASGLYLYLLFVMALAIACYWRQSPSSERYIPGVEQIGVRRAGSP